MDNLKQEEILRKLCEPFEASEIGKLPKPTKQQTDEVKRDFKNGARCNICGGWHHPKVVHLDYVGHAALTARLLKVDIAWNWDFLSVGDDGLPVVDQDGGLWIKLTVAGVTRLGYGAADGKRGSDAMKERIGDALRNAAMRFGAALDLWHKGDLHIFDEPAQNESTPLEVISDKDAADIKQRLKNTNSDVKAFLKALNIGSIDSMPANFLGQAKTMISKKEQTLKAAS